MRMPICWLLLALLPAAAQAQAPQFHRAPGGAAAPYSPAVRAGDLIFVSGQIGTRADGTLAPSTSEQTRVAMENTRTALALAGAMLDDVVKCTVMLADMREWAAFNDIYVTFFTPGRLPARSALGVNGLAKGAAVEVECIAYKPLLPSG